MNRKRNDVAIIFVRVVKNKITQKFEIAKKYKI